MAVPVDLLLLRQALKELAGDDVLQPNQACIGLVRVIDDTLAYILIGAGTEMVSLHLRSATRSVRLLFSHPLHGILTEFLLDQTKLSMIQPFRYLPSCCIHNTVFSLTYEC